MKREIKNGDNVIYIDEYGKEHPALITQCWVPSATWDDEQPFVNQYRPQPDQNAMVNWPPCINIVYVSGDPNRKDQYGNQTVHESSVPHFKTQDPNMSHTGRAWRLVEEGR